MVVSWWRIVVDSVTLLYGRSELTQHIDSKLHVDPLFGQLLDRRLAETSAENLRIIYVCYLHHTNALLKSMCSSVSLLHGQMNNV